MPVCKICRKRIELAFRGVRAYRCSSCKSTVCKEHFDFEGKICHLCAGIPIVEAKGSFIESRSGNEDKG